MNFSRNTYKLPSVRYIRLLWSIKKLVSNLLIWNILARLLVSVNSLINPGLSDSGAKIFQVLLNDQLAITSIISFVAFCSWLFEDVLFYKFLTKKGLGSLFLFRIFFLLPLIVFTFFLVSLVYYKPLIATNLPEYFASINDFFFNSASAYLFVTGILIATFINFFKAIQQKVGIEKFWPYITGQFRTPKEENRIFVFIDLISSTKFAEQLGHKKYSLFLQECFKHLGMLEIKYGAMQYQFVGDEAVLSWPAKKRNYLYAVQFYYEYVSILNSKSEYFSENFGVIPQFTASINSGNVMVSEVGTVRSEIAFHGDVLNTAARIQKYCKNHKKPLLVTQDFAIEFKENNPADKVVYVASSKLHGKKEPVNIYTIEM